MSSTKPPLISATDSVPGSELTNPTAIPDSALWGRAEGGILLTANSPAGDDEQSDFSETMLLPHQGLGSDNIGQIGRYTLTQPIGEGGLGMVYAANDPLLSRPIAIKTLSVALDPAQRETFNAMFLAEARAAAGLSHPHIVTVFDAGISDDKAYIAMELLKGRDLRQLRADGWRPTPAQSALIARRVADALSYAHHKGVIHRDIKPANIFMVGRTQPRVLDFGIARVARPSEISLGRGTDDEGPSAASPYYMSPEQARQETVDRRSDVFSLGVVLYELLTDRKPFTGKNLREITEAVLSHEPPMAHVLDANVPQGLSEIVARAMQKDPEKRTRSARTLSHELRQWLDDQSRDEASDNTQPREGLAVPLPPSARSPASATHASSRAGERDGESTQENRPGRPSTHRGLWVAVPMVAIGAIAVAVHMLNRPSVPATESSASTASAPLLVAEAPVSASSASASAAGGWVDAALAPGMASALPADVAQSRGAASSVSEAIPQSKVTEVRLPDRRPKESAKDRKPREASPTSPEPSTPALGAGFLKIAVSPWGHVEIDGKPVGISPPLTDIKLLEGKHQIVIRNDDFPVYSSTIQVSPNQTVTLRHKFGS